MIGGSQDKKVQPLVVMVGTGLQTMGGISTVVQGYLSAGLFDTTPIKYVRSHSDGTFGEKLKVAVAGYIEFIPLVTQKQVRLVHIHLSSRASFWRKLPFALTSKLARKPYVFHVHGSEFMTFYHEECGAFRKRIVRWAFDHATALIALSPEWAENLKQITRNTNIEVILNRVPVPHQKMSRQDASEAPHILFLGRLGKRKGIYDVLEALVTMRERGTRFRLIAAGDGELEEVETRVRDLGLQDHVSLPGWIDDETRSELLSRAEIFVLPSYAEGLPMSLLEAMAAGLPVIASSVGGIPNAVTNGKEGILIAAGDVPALSDALDTLLSDVTMRREMGNNAYKRAQDQFDVRHSVDQLISLYDQYGKP